MTRQPRRSAYKAFLKLAPSDSQAPAARQALKALEAQAKASATTTTRHDARPRDGCRDGREKRVARLRQLPVRVARLLIGSEEAIFVRMQQSSTRPRMSSSPSRQAAARSATSASGNPQVGKGLFQQKCAACHTLADAGTTGTIGPNLDDAFLPRQAAGLPALDDRRRRPRPDRLPGLEPEHRHARA